MKNILLLVLGLFLISCEKDHQQYEIPNYLVGNWQVLQEGKINVDNIIDYEDIDIHCPADQLVFNSNYAFSHLDYILADENCILTPRQGIYQMVNRTILLTETEQGILLFNSLTIIALTYNILEISFTNPDTGQLTFFKLFKINS